MKLLLCVLALAGMAAGQTTSVTTKIVCADKNLKQVPCLPIANGYSTPPRSVPAVRKTRKIDYISIMKEQECKDLHGVWSSNNGACSHWDEQYWDCADPDRALIVSQNGKKAACWLVE